MTAGLMIGRAFRVLGCARGLAAAIPLVLAGAITGCVSTTPPTAPETQAASSKEETQPLSGSTNIIHVMPIEGIGGPLRLVLADAVAASLRDSERPAVLAAEANDRGPSVAGKVTRVRPRGSVVWISTTWSLLAPFGTVVAERNREIVVDKSYWDRNSVEVVNLVVGDAMPAVAAMVQDHVGPLHVAQDVVEEPIQPVLGNVDPTPATPPEPALFTEQTAVPETTQPDPAVPPVAERLEAAPETVNPPAAAPQPASRPPMALKPGAAHSQLPATATDPGLARVDAPAGQDANSTTAPIADLTASVDREMARLNEQAAEPNDVQTLDAAPDTPVAGTADAPPAVAPTSQPAPAGGIAASPGDTPVVWGRPSFLIRGISGAPGDGNQALGTALRSALHGKDLTVTDDPRQAGYEVLGTVDIGPPINGRQRARISWVVNTIAGEEVGKAIQENVIAAGSLNRSWGKVAEIVSAAAADGIQQLFEAPRPKFTPVGAVPDFPKVPDLPRVPGRALPPPPS